MMSPLEEFINEHRDEFDDQVPPPRVWDHIEADMKKGSRVHLKPPAVYRWSLGIAATLVIAMGVYFFVHKTREELAVSQAPPADSATNTIVADGMPQVYQFARMIDARQKELKTLSRDQPELYRTFMNDIIQLDSSYNLLKTRLKDTPNQEMLVEAMIRNLELQLMVLNQQLDIIKEIKKTKKIRYEKKYEAV